MTHTAEPGEGSDKPIQGVCISQQWAPDRSCLLRRIQTVKRKTEELEKEEEEADNCLNRKSYFFSRFQISTSTWSVHQGLNWATVSVPETC